MDTNLLFYKQTRKQPSLHEKNAVLTDNDMAFRAHRS
jgi:hypothetical protein